MAKILDSTHESIPIDGAIDDRITVRIRGDNLNIVINSSLAGVEIELLVELERKEVIKLYERIHREHEAIKRAFHD